MTSRTQDRGYIHSTKNLRLISRKHYPNPQTIPTNSAIAVYINYIFTIVKTAVLINYH